MIATSKNRTGGSPGKERAANSKSRERPARTLSYGWRAAFWGLVGAVVGVLIPIEAQDGPPGKATAAEAGAPSPASTAEAPVKANAAAVTAGSATNSASEKTNASPEKLKDGPVKADEGSSTNELQVSFQGANIDMIVQWLAQNTGKSVIKHPQVQCQLTIMSSKKVTPREAINLVYRALSLEGFTAVESANSILIVPEGKEPKLNPELLDGSRTNIPEGRQRLVKIFPLAHIQATELRDKVRGVLSEKGTIDADDRANQVVVTDYNDNLRLLAELIREFDVPSSGLVIEIYVLKHADAEELGNLIGLILNSQAGPASGRSPRSGSSSPGPGTPGGPPGPSPGGESAGSGSGGGGQTTQKEIRIWPDKTANRLIVSAPKSRLVEVQRLIDVLDTDKPEDVAVRIIPLKHVSAQDLVREVAPLYQKMSGKAPKEMIEIAANDRSNSLIVLASEMNFKAIEKLIAGMDTEDAGEKTIRTFPLKNADATDVAQQLQDLNKDQDSRYPYYFFSSSQNRGGSKKMSVVADRRRNSLVIQAPPAQMDSIEKMIHELDEPVSDDSLAPRIFHLKYVSAVDIEDVLNELFLKKTNPVRPYWYYDENPDQQADRDVGRLYGKVRITAEPYSNTIIVTSNSKESLSVVEDVLKQLDQPSEAGESTLRVGLRFAKASLVANSINILFAKNGSPPLRAPNQQGQQQNPTPQQQAQQQLGSSSQAAFELEQETKEEGYYPWLGGQPDNPRGSDGRSASRPVSDLVGRVRAVADQRSNALLISANVHFFPQVLKLIEDLDAQTDQVLIEARIVEVASDFLDKLGVRYSPDGTKVFTADDYDNSILAHGSVNYLKGFGNNSTVNSPSSPSAGTVQALTTLRSGVLESTVNMDLLIQFLRKTTDARVLAEPQINIRDNETGRLFVGQQVPVPQYTTFAGVNGSQNTAFTYKDVGIVLEVTPHINSSGDVELRLHAESSTVVPGQTVLGGSVFDTRNFRTDLSAKNGQTLVLGGIIQKQMSDIERKTPILGDIPGLGWAFKKKDKSTREVELMVFMRPHVTRTPEESQDLLKEIYQKAPHAKGWEDGIEPKQVDKQRKKSMEK